MDTFLFLRHEHSHQTIELSRIDLEAFSNLRATYKHRMLGFLILLQDKIKIQDCEISLEDIYRKVGFEVKA